MKKSLIALAAMSAVSGAAFAQSTVTVYGVLDAGYSDMKKEISGTVDTQKALSFSNYTSSRFGLRGTEDLGGGLKANFVIESGISSNVTTGSAGFLPGTSTAVGKTGTTLDATTLGNRELNASIVSGDTTAKIGYGGTAVRSVVLAFDAANGANLVGNILTNDVQFSSNRATAAGVSQKFGKFTVGAALTANKDTRSNSTDVDTGSGWIGDLGYNDGKFAFGYAHQDATTKVRAVTGSTINTALSNNTIATTASTSCTAGLSMICQTLTAAVTGVDKKVKTDVFGASYDFGAAKVFAQHGKVKTTDSVTVDAVGEGTRSGSVLGIQAPVGKTVLFATVSDGSVSQAVTAGTAAVKRDYTGYAVGALYNLSKRTTAYAATGSTKLDGTSGNTNEVKVDQVAVGVAHSF